MGGLHGRTDDQISSDAIAVDYGVFFLFGVSFLSEHLYILYTHTLLNPHMQGLDSGPSNPSGFEGPVGL